MLLKSLYEIILIIYGLSLIGYFIDFIQNNQKANKLAFWLLHVVWFIQTLFLFYQVLQEGTFPIATFHDSLFFYSWLLIAISLIMARFFSIRFIVFFINIFGFFLLLLYFAISANTQLPESGIQFVHEILVAHIVLALISYALFTISFLFSLMYMIQYHFLKDKKNVKWIKKFGDLKKLDQYSFTLNTIGVPLLLIAIILGIVWAYVSGSAFFWLDTKTIGSVLVFLVYIGYLFFRLFLRYQGIRLTVYNAAAFFILFVNYFVSSSLSDFHF